MQHIQLTDEQLLFLSHAKTGKNILVDACIGSGKTSSIQLLCEELPLQLRILYLTYNRLLKLDARDKIRSKNVTVTNYHGFAGIYLRKIGVRSGVSDMIQVFLKEKPMLDHYDVLILDEYQDIDQEIADLLLYIKQSNPNIQIIAVGDMEQKIYDKTSLDVRRFIDGFLDEYIKVSFTVCFRLQASLASKLGRIWNKPIVGVNEHCQVEEMDVEAVISFLASQNPENVLCLGTRTGKMADVLNKLETVCPDKYNKKTVYASINDDDAGAVQPGKENAIFTTFDSSKGLERRICVVFDFTDSYWETRKNKPQQSYVILRNIFCVAASRGKDRIIFVNEGKDMLSEATLSKPFAMNRELKNLNISTMFDFKHKESIEKCFSMLCVNRIDNGIDHSVISVESHDELIDLSPCIGMYQEASFFSRYNIDVQLMFLEYFGGSPLLTQQVQRRSLEEKILYFTSCEKRQNRYRTQVKIPFIQESEKKQLQSRLGTIFSENEEVQVFCRLNFHMSKDDKEVLPAIGLADVVKDHTVYELKFVSELKHEHFLQCACYMVALQLQRGIVWNTRNNEMYEISIPNKDEFMSAVLHTIRKETVPDLPRRTITESKEQNGKKGGEPNMSGETFAVIDTETNWDDKVMSIGLVIADAETLEAIDKRYYIITPECLRGGMYSGVLLLKNIQPSKRYSRKDAIQNAKQFLEKYQVHRIFAYNASFDYKHLPELSAYEWYDIMRLAAYKQYNSKIPAGEECYSTGRLKKGYNVESMYRLLTHNRTYCESHNALADTIDELTIMKCLGYKPNEYGVAIILEKKRTSEKKQNISKGQCSMLQTSPVLRDTMDFECEVNKNAEKTDVTERVVEGADSDLGLYTDEQNNVEKIYQEAMSKFSSADILVLQEAVEQLNSISGRKLVSQDIKVFQSKIKAIRDEENLLKEREYAKAFELSSSQKISDLRLAIAKLRRIGDWKNACELIIAIERKISNIEKDNEKERRKNNMLCQYCGGVFGGIFIKKCKSCGKKKDY